MQINLRQGIYLAALLHDIGKFWQRASSRDETLSASTKKIQADLCPEYNGHFSHKHVLWTSEFFEKYSSVLPQTIDVEGKNIQIGYLSARHHKRDLSGIELIISFADRLSSGHDRRQKTEQQLAELEHRDYERFKKTRLQNVFDNVFRSVNETYYPITGLESDSSVFAKEMKEQDEKAMTEYKKLWELFGEQIEKLPKDNFEAQATSLLSLLKTYTWCIPSSTMEQPDVSLFDHLKTTAAISISLYDSQDEHGKLPTSMDGLKKDSIDRFTLIGGDFSGIQDFIYQINSKAAAKTLKGRSFYLQLILDSILAEVKTIYQVQDAHILFASGGRFYMLVPNLTSKWGKTVSLIDDINLRLLQQYNGALYLALNKIDFRASVLMDPKGYPDLIEKVQDALEHEKSRRFSRQITNNESFFDPDDLKGLTADDVCKITGTDLYPDEEFVPPDKRNRASKESSSWRGEEGSISKAADEQIKLGQKLRNAKWIIRYKRSKSSDYEFEPLDLGYTYRLYSNEELKKEQIQNAERIIALNDTLNFLEGNQGDGSVGCTYQFYGAAWTPRDEQGEVLDFTSIAEDDQIDALGIVRMDVDNLGRAFKDGFKRQQSDGEEDIASISRATTLSSQLDWFFSGYLNHLLSGGFDPTGSELVLPSKPSANIHPYGRHIYPVYAGGDDVFLITRWDIAPVLAKRIYDDFKRFTNQNPKLTISGGISVIQPKSPIHKGANDAGEAESLAKKLGPERKKDAISWLGRTLGWQDFELVSEMVTEFKKLIGRMNNRSLIGLLRDTSADFILLKRLKEEGKTKTDPLYGRWRWRAAYQLTRMKKQHKEIAELGRGEIGGEVFLTGTYKGRKPTRTEKTEIIEILPLVTKWLTLLTRKTRKN